MTRWVKPEVYPLFAAMGFVVSICVFQLGRNLITNPDVRIAKTNRSAGVVENYEEGERYAEHRLRHFLRRTGPQVLPSLDAIFVKKDH